MIDNLEYGFICVAVFMTRGLLASIATGGEGENLKSWNSETLRSYVAGRAVRVSESQFSRFAWGRCVKSCSVGGLQYLLHLGVLEHKLPQSVKVICIGMRERAT